MWSVNCIASIDDHVHKYVDASRIYPRKCAGKIIQPCLGAGPSDIRESVTIIITPSVNPRLHGRMPGIAGIPEYTLMRTRKEDVFATCYCKRASVGPCAVWVTRERPIRGYISRFGRRCSVKATATQSNVMIATRNRALDFTSPSSVGLSQLSHLPCYGCCCGLFFQKQTSRRDECSTDRPSGLNRDAAGSREMRTVAPNVTSAALQGNRARDRWRRYRTFRYRYTADIRYEPPRRPSRTGGSPVGEKLPPRIPSLPDLSQVAAASHRHQPHLPPLHPPRRREAGRLDGYLRDHHDAGTATCGTVRNPVEAKFLAANFIPKRPLADRLRVVAAATKVASSPLPTPSSAGGIPIRRYGELRRNGRLRSATHLPAPSGR